MTVIQKLNKQYERYIAYCMAAMTTKINIIDIDCSKGETDRTRIFYFEKNDCSFDKAIAILTLRLKMYKEQWNDLNKYTEKNIILWTFMLEKEYEKSQYFSRVGMKLFKENFYLNRLKNEQQLKSIQLNSNSINFEQFEAINPIPKKNLTRISYSKFKRAEEEFYFETETHYVLFNWYTTA